MASHLVVKRLHVPLPGTLFPIPIHVFKRPPQTNFSILMRGAVMSRVAANGLPMFLLHELYEIVGRWGGVCYNTFANTIAEYEAAPEGGRKLSSTDRTCLALHGAIHPNANNNVRYCSQASAQGGLMAGVGREAVSDTTRASLAHITHTLHAPTPPTHRKWRFQSLIIATWRSSSRATKIGGIGYRLLTRCSIPSSSPTLFKTKKGGVIPIHCRHVK